MSEIRITFEDNIKRTVFLHDPKFFIMLDNSVFVPFLRLYDPTAKNFEISATNIKKMNRPKIFNCNTDPNYNFRECVRQKISNREGCVSPFDHKTTDTLPLCSNVSSLDKFENFYHIVHLSSNREELEELTGCLLPCSYTRYNLAYSTPISSWEKFDDSRFSIR